DAKVGEPLVRDLLRRERPRNDADHLAVGAEHRVGKHTHQPDAAAAVDEPDAARNELTPERRRRVGVGRPSPEARAAEHADAAENTGHRQRIVQPPARSKANCALRTCRATRWELRAPTSKCRARETSRAATV